MPRHFQCPCWAKPMLLPMFAKPQLLLMFPSQCWGQGLSTSDPVANPLSHCHDVSNRGCCPMLETETLLPMFPPPKVATSTCFRYPRCSRRLSWEVPSLAKLKLNNAPPAALRMKPASWLSVLPTPE